MTRYQLHPCPVCGYRPFHMELKTNDMKCPNCQTEHER